uniref:Fluoride ion transporter CrcB n=1 Tax=Skeletonema marinoi TaxID=267567 RepID=A0A7S2LIE8_9STRA|mmetsp:Transcript_25713/g.43616  ORF Transcript_25713/g.43616 Transcript_25713/m.43616 type:complete len:662 (+) Transcript_25713:46-2031(+)
MMEESESTTASQPTDDGDGGRTSPVVEGNNHLAIDGDDHSSLPSMGSDSNQQHHDDKLQQHIIQQFWRTYDEVIILSICSIFGIAFRLLGASWFRLELNFVFSQDSALGTNLPLNILSCFLMGLLCSGRESMPIVHAKVLGGGIAGRGIVDVGRWVINRSRGGIRFRRRRRNNQTESSQNGIVMTTIDSNRSDQVETSDILNISMNSSTGVQRHDDSNSIAGLLGLDEEFRIGMNHCSEDEIRSVQLNALTRRIMMSPSLVLFPAKKDHSVFSEHQENVNVPDDGFDDQFEIGDSNDDISDEGHDDDNKTSDQAPPSGESSRESEDRIVGSPRRQSQGNVDAEQGPTTSSETILEGVNERLQSLSNNVTAIRHADFASGWKVGTSPEDMKHIILIGLRIGFCGAVSTFSSWNSAMVNLVKNGKWGEAMGGYAIGLQLGIVAYLFGQHVAVYIFVWRRRRETRRAERRGYAFRLRASGSHDSIDEEELEANDSMPVRGRTRRIRQRYIPSVRSLATMFFFTMFIVLLLAVFLLPKRQEFAISLLFTPFGTFTRWKLANKYNKRLPGFPLGTFSVNLLSCALSGSLGSFLSSAGPEESIVLSSMIAGFAGSLSTFAMFIIEIISLIDPIIFKFDGFIYALTTILWGLIIGLTSSQAKNWADDI